MSEAGAATFPARPEPGGRIHKTFFIGGEWRASAGSDWGPVYDCGTEQEIGRVLLGTPEDVDAAVKAAQRALPGWRMLEPLQRAEQLRALHRELSKRADELAALISAEVGTAIRFSGAIQVASSLGQLELTADVLTRKSFTKEFENTTVVQEPVGVVAAITPWNYPLYQTMTKVAGGLAAGCTVVHKPSELAPLSSFVLADAIEAAGLPAGVYNLVSGTGPVVGEAMATHPSVRMVSFTGSTGAGTRVYELAARSIKRVALELGGKSASVLFDDADLQTAVRTTVNRAFLNSGQTCDAWTRLLVPRARVGDVLDAATAAAGRLTLGDQFDPNTRLGPLISERQVGRVRHYVEGALQQGASAAIGGPAKPKGLEQGHFFSPTILSGVTRDMTVAQEEVFGPVLAVLAYDSEAEALDLANATDYGLSGAIWSADAERANRFAAQMDAGQIVINGGKFNPTAPFGGMKRSGIGREMGLYGLDEFLEPKALQH